MLADKGIGLLKSQLDTPCLVIDKKKLLANLDSMAKLAKAKKVALRPHAKTHKCTRIAKLQLEYGACGICAAKVSEALVMARAGIHGILITSPLVTQTKMEKLIEVLRLAPDTMLVVDNLQNARDLSQLLTDKRLNLTVLVDLDGGIGRTGVNFDDALSFALQVNSLPGLKLIGIQCYAGHLQHIADLVKRRAATHEVLLKAAAIKQELQEEGVNCLIQTGSGTGTFSLDAEIEAVTEIQPGSYCVMDQEYSDIHYKEQVFLSAMTMLTSVISTNHKSHVTVDAGTKAMYRVATRPEVINPPGLTYDWDGFGDEHAKVRAKAGYPLPGLGEVLELRVAHCDPTINLFDRFYITEDDVVVDCWEIDLRGCCQ